MGDWGQIPQETASRRARTAAAAPRRWSAAARCASASRSACTALLPAPLAAPASDLPAGRGPMATLTPPTASFQARQACLKPPLGERDDSHQVCSEAAFSSHFFLSRNRDSLICFKNAQICALIVVFPSRSCSLCLSLVSYLLFTSPTTFYVCFWCQRWDSAADLGKVYRAHHLAMFVISRGQAICKRCKQAYVCVCGVQGVGRRGRVRCSQPPASRRRQCRCYCRAIGCCCCNGRSLPSSWPPAGTPRPPCASSPSSPTARRACSKVLDTGTY